MEENAAALDAVQNAIRALGRGFDVTCDTRLLYCKGVGGARVVEVDEDHTRELPVFGDLAVPNVPRDVRCSEGSTKRVSTAICSFHEVSRSHAPCLPSEIGLGSSFSSPLQGVNLPFLPAAICNGLHSLFGI